MTPAAPLSYDGAVRQVEEMTMLGTSLAHIENAIALASAAEEEEAALWLFAWSLRKSPLRHARLPGRAAAATGGRDF